ncbi:MAG TPA: trypsin-like peptidase domain-containing protein [Acidimicrobiia bacterium]|jgi:putative serine protease PepD
MREENDYEPVRADEEPRATTSVESSEAKSPAPRRARATVVLVSAVALVSGGIGGATVLAATHLSPSSGASKSPAAAAVVARPVGTALDITGIANRLAPSVVTIRGNTPDGTAAGTGIVIGKNGEILTNAHVVSSDEQITVSREGESRARSATLIGLDTDADVALIRVGDTTGLQPAQLGDSSALHVGDPVVAIGDALDLGSTPSVTQGIVSALGRNVDTMTGVIQTDAAVNPGNSGGPLVNREGQVVGINTAVATNPETGAPAQSIGFAIPINRATHLLPELRSGGAPDSSNPSSSPDQGGSGQNGAPDMGGSPFDPFQGSNVF